MSIVENMARTQAVENLRDLKLVLGHADSLVSRLEGHLNRLPLDRAALSDDVSELAIRLATMGSRLAHASQGGPRDADLLS